MASRFRATEAAANSGEDHTILWQIGHNPELGLMHKPVALAGCCAMRILTNPLTGSRNMPLSMAVFSMAVAEVLEKAPR